MHRLIWRAAAADDLRKITDWTEDKYGAEQAARYVGRIGAAAASLRDYPLKNPRHDSRHGTFRKMRCGQHMLFYIVTSDEVAIIRVLHVRMNPNDLLD